MEMEYMMMMLKPTKDIALQQACECDMESATTKPCVFHSLIQKQRKMTW